MTDLRIQDTHSVIRQNTNNLIAGRQCIKMHKKQLKLQQKHGIKSDIIKRFCANNSNE